MTFQIRLTRVLLAATFAGLCTVLPGDAVAQPAAVVGHDAWMREPMPNRGETAIFVVLENTGTEPRSIVGVSTTVAEKSELHNVVMDGSMMKMTPVKAIELKAKSKTELRPGSYHIMLFGLKERPAAGATVPVTLTLDNGQSVALTATVRKVEGMMR